MVNIDHLDQKETKNGPKKQNVIKIAFLIAKLILQKYFGNLKYHKVESSNMSCLEAHAGFFRLLIKGIFEHHARDIIC